MEGDSKVPGCKVVLLGDSGVGKTCIISRYISGTFDENSATTNGASYCSKNVNYEKLGKNLLLDIWDTAGQEKYKALTKFFYKDAAVCILVYDITRKETFDNLKNFWYSQLKENSGSNVVLGVAGNKCDLYESEDVKESEARQFAEEIGAIFELTSAQNNTGINELFFEVGNKYLDPNFKPSKDEDNPDNKDDKKKIVLKKDDVKKDDKKPKRSFC
jgi:small GTP-binding protein